MKGYTTFNRRSFLITAFLDETLIEPNSVNINHNFNYSALHVSIHVVNAGKYTRKIQTPNALNYKILNW